MDSNVIMINPIARLSAFYREKEFKKIGLGEMHHAYILSICSEPGISQEELACKLFINKSNVARQLAEIPVEQQEAVLSGLQHMMEKAEIEMCRKEEK